MIECVLAAVGVIGIVKYVHARRHGYGGPCGGGGRWRHHGGWDQQGPEEYGEPRGFGRGFFLRRALEPLEMSPSQERAVHGAIDEFQEAARGQRGELRQSRKDIAQAFRRSSFDEVAMGELYARHDTAIEALRRAFVGAGAKIHDALDEKQRARLADLIESGPRFFGRRWSGRDRVSWSW